MAFTMDLLGTRVNGSEPVTALDLARSLGKEAEDLYSALLQQRLAVIERQKVANQELAEVDKFLAVLGPVVNAVTKDGKE